MEAACPYCAIKMTTVVFREWSIWLCPRCEGTFYDEAVLRDLLQQPDLRMSYLRPALLPNLATDHPPEVERPRINCPLCRETLVRENYSSDHSLLVDRCPQGHGLWLDDGELGALAEGWEELHTHQEPGFFEALRRLVGLKPKISFQKRPEAAQP